jgi:isochorismate synthase
LSVVNYFITKKKIDLFTAETIFEKIEKHYKNKLPFVVYRKPNASMVKGLFQLNNNLHVTENYKEKGFVFAPFNDTENSILIPFDDSENFEANFDLKEQIIYKKNESSFQEEDKLKHINLVEKGIEAINNNHFKKVVLARTEVVNLQAFSIINTFKNLLFKYNLAFVYCWYHPKVGLWFGATPETLMKVEGQKFSIMALAGTQEYKNSLNVVWEEKEKQEQQIVTDYITNSIAPFVNGVVVSEVETVRAGNLVHLKTMISANLNSWQSNLESIISALHPTPAVCGMPKKEAMEFILKNESHNRGFYSGYLGELNYESKSTLKSSKRNIENRAYSISRKCTQLYVNLRCMQIKDNAAIVYVGGGITKSSNPLKEWEETVAKSKVIKSIL